MQMVDMFYKELEDAKKRKVPFVIPIGTIEYHAHHASCGTDTMVINGVMRELEKTKEMVEELKPYFVERFGKDERNRCMSSNLVWGCKLCSSRTGKWNHTCRCGCI